MNDEMVEVRITLKRSTLDIADAISLARKVSRSHVIDEVTGVWADQIHRESSMVLKIAGHKPTFSAD